MKAIIALTALILSTAATAQETSKEDLLTEAQLANLYMQEIKQYLIPTCFWSLEERFRQLGLSAPEARRFKTETVEWITLNYGLEYAADMVERQQPLRERITTYNLGVTGCLEILEMEYRNKYPQRLN